MKKLIFTMILVLVLGALAACSSDSSKETSNQPSGKPKDGGEIAIGLNGDPMAFNPLYTADKTSLVIQQAVFAPLFYTNDGKVTPALADKLTVGEDNVTYTLTLKPNLKWHDGQPLTADDIVFTVNSILDEKQNSWLRGSFVFDNKPVQAKAINATTVEFKVPTVTPAFEAAVNVLYPIPKHVFENEADIQKSEKNNTPIGSGPFKFKEYKPGQYVQVERFDDYFDTKAHLDKIVFRILKDDNAANLALQNGEINMKALDPSDVEKIKSQGKANVITYPEYRMTYVAFNQNIEEFKNLKFRQALSYALDRDELIKAAFGSKEFGEPASSILTPDVKYQTTDVETFKYDLKKAKELIKESKVDTSKEFNILFVNNNKSYEGIALYMQQQFKKIGVNLVIDAKDPSATYAIADDRQTKDYALYLDAYIMRSEPDAYKQLYAGDALYNYQNYHNDAVDALWTKAAVTPNGPDREALYKEIQQTLAKEAIVYPVSYDNNVIAIDKKYQGVEDAKPQQLTLLRDFSKLYIAE